MPAIDSASSSLSLYATRSLLAIGLLAALAGCSADSAPAASGAVSPEPTSTDAPPAAGAVADAAQNPAAPATQLDPSKTEQIVKEMLAKAYGEQSFKAADGCWSHSLDGANGEVDYCMKPDAPKVVATASGTQVYFQTYSDPEADAYSLVDPGLRGLFAATVAADGSWKPLAVTPAMDQGQAGDCGCRNAELVQVGPALYGWKSTAGGTWQGVTVALNDLQVPMDGTFRNVSRIPQSVESAPQETVRVQIDAQGAPVAGFYPLKATRTRDGKDVGSTVIAFDPGSKTYPWAQ